MTPDWDARYDTPDYIFGREPNAFLVSQAHRLDKPSRILCVADGEGRNGVWLARQGHEVVSMDGSRAALAKAGKLAAEAGVDITLEQADIAEWPWDDAQFDAVVGIFIQFAPPDLRSRIFAGMKRTVRPGGLILLQGYRPEQIAYGTGGPKVPENLYDADLLTNAFSDFEIIELNEHDDEIREGTGHSGMSALIDLVARRRA